MVAWDTVGVTRNNHTHAQLHHNQVKSRDDIMRWVQAHCATGGVTITNFTSEYVGSSLVAAWACVPERGNLKRTFVGGRSSRVLSRSLSLSLSLSLSR